MANEAEQDRGPIDDRRYAEIKDVAHFTVNGYGPIILRIGVRANVHPSTNYPRARIMIGQLDMPHELADFGGVVMTVQQAEELIDGVKAAIKDALKACPSLRVESVPETSGG